MVGGYSPRGCYQSRGELLLWSELWLQMTEIQFKLT